LFNVILIYIAVKSKIKKDVKNMINPRLYKLDVSADNLMKSTKNIAQWERVTGTAEEMQAFLYIQKELEKFGAKTKLYKHDAYSSVPKDAELIVEGRKYQCRPHALLPSTPAQGLQRRLVYGGKPGQLTSEICEDNIVLIEASPDEVPLDEAQQLGAAGVVFIGGEYIQEICLSPVWGSPSYLNKHLLFRIPAVSITMASAEQIKKQLVNGSAEAKLTARVESSWCSIPLLTAEIRALKPTKKYVMFCGHVDSWYYGAMDNGTANATMIEVGRLAAQWQKKLEYNLRLVFYSGHSQGRYAGSAWYFDNFWEDIHKNCIISINADSLGGKDADDFTRSTVMPETKGVVVEIIKELTGVEFIGRRYGRFADQSYWGAGVSCAFASFSKHRSGVPLGWWWHTTEDAFDKIDQENLLRDARIFAAYVMHFLTSRVISLDFRATAIEILGILREWQSQAGEYFDLKETIERAEQLVVPMNKFYEHVPDEQADNETVSDFNQTLWELGRILVPLNFTHGNIYENEHALPQSPMPSLEAISKLAIAADEDGRKELVVDLVRRRNYVLHSLAQALDVVRKN
jgi:hypothetical protein